MTNGKMIFQALLLDRYIEIEREFSNAPGQKASRSLMVEKGSEIMEALPEGSITLFLDLEGMMIDNRTAFAQETYYRGIVDGIYLHRLFAEYLKKGGIEKNDDDN